RVDYQAFAVPRAVIAIDDLLPGRHPVARNVGGAPVHAAFVLRGIGTDDLDVERLDARTFGDGSPRVARERPRVHAVGDDEAAEAQVVVRDRLRDRVALALDAPPGGVRHRAAPERDDVYAPPRHDA